MLTKIWLIEVIINIVFLIEAFKHNLLPLYY